MSAASILKRLESRGFKLAIAESLTGGLLSAEFVSVPGASNVLLGSIVAYQTSLKHELLGVSRTLLENQGPVDPEVAAGLIPINPTPWLCSDTCPAVVDGIIAYRDKSHLTVAMSEHLSTKLESALRSLGLF